MLREPEVKLPTVFLLAFSPDSFYDTAAFLAINIAVNSAAGIGLL